MAGKTPLYDPIAAEYEEHAKESSYNALYDRPAMFRLIGDVTGKRVLDAGCGPGFYAEELLARGADSVTAFDQSSKVAEVARARLPDFVEVRVHDMAEPLTWVEDNSYDVVVMALVLHYIDDRVAALKELFRVLRTGGHLVISTHHPTLDWGQQGGSYFTTEVVEETWSKGWKMRYWRLPLTQTCAEFAEAGFLIERLEEPLPAAEMAQTSPRHYERLNREPGFINFRLVKPSTL